MSLITKEQISILKSTDFLELRQISTHGINYYYSHDAKFDGEIVAIIPYTRVGDKHDGLVVDKVLIRSEMVPCWNVDENHYKCITGGVEEKHRKLDDTIYSRYCAIDELKEEAGYQVNNYDFIYLGECFVSKSSDTLVHLFGIDLTDKDRDIEPEGDGSELEKISDSFWVDLDDPIIESIKDPLFFTLICKLLYKDNKSK